MNNSGEGVSYLLTRFAAQPQDLLVIYDDMELPLGKLRIRRQGSDGGHNGIRSIISSLKGQDFPRLRVGIGHPPLDQGSIPYLLGSVESAEAKAISDAIATVVDAVDCVITEDMDTAMNRFN
jgi:PTH1 family peptidyl-tRNA hydrolase